MEIHDFTQTFARIFKYSYCFLLLITKDVEPIIISDPNMAIGVIARDINYGTADVKEISIIRYNFNVTLHWYATNVQEIYQIFRSVKVLDDRKDIELIVLLDYDPLFPDLNQILETQNKPLVKWGEVAEQSIIADTTVTENILTVASQDLCGDDSDPSLLSGDTDCLTDLNTTQDATGANVSLTNTAPSAMLKLVKALGWKTVFVIHDNSTEWETMELINLMSKNSIMIVIYNIDRVVDMNRFLGNAYNITVKTSTEIDFVVLSRFSTARRLLKAANGFDSLNNHKTSLRSFTRWLVAVYGHTYGVSRALQACADDLDNVVIVAFPDFQGTATEKEFTHVIEEILFEAYKEHIDVAENITFSSSVIEKLQAKSSSWSPTHKCKGFKIDTLLWTLSGRFFSTVGYVSVTGDVVMMSDLFPNTKNGYNKRKFIVTTLSYEPFVMKETVNGTTRYKGFCMDLLNELARTLNFTFELTEPKDQKWGSLEADNVSFNGLIGQAQRQECDMVMAPISIQPNRVKVVDFSYPFFYDYTSVLVKKPDPSKTKWRTLVDPFKWEVLLCIGIALALMTFLAFLIEKYNPYYQVPEYAEIRGQTGGLHTFHDAFWYMYGALLCQGGVHLPESWAGRTFVSFWWLFCMIVVAIYCGNLIAFLTVTMDKPPFSSLEELITMKSEFKWGTLGGTSWEDVFIRDAKRYEFQEIGKGLVEFNKSDPNIMNGDPYYHLERVKQGGYAWIGDKTFIELAIAEECGLLTIKEEFLPLKYALVFPKHSTHLTTFSNQIISIHESGLLQIWKRRWWPKSNFCAGSIVTEAKPIAIVDVQSAFYVCALGVLIGTTAFICEIISHRCSQNKNVKDKLVSIKCTMNGSLRPDSNGSKSVSFENTESRHCNEEIQRSQQRQSSPHIQLNCRKKARQSN